MSLTISVYSVISPIYIPNWNCDMPRKEKKKEIEKKEQK